MFSDRHESQAKLEKIVAKLGGMPLVRGWRKRRRPRTNMSGARKPATCNRRPYEAAMRRREQDMLDAEAGVYAQIECGELPKLRGNEYLQLVQKRGDELTAARGGW